jgi:putative transposase
MRYAQYFNLYNGLSGHLWEGRFFSCILDQGHLYYAIRYVEQNPVRAGMVKYPWEHQWSSARWHVGQRNEKYIFLKESLQMDVVKWKEYLLNNDKDVEKRIRSSTRTGLAVATDSFIDYWEKKLNCVLRMRKVGRPKNAE